MTREFLNVAAIAFLALFPILNPPAMAPIFFDMTSALSKPERYRLAALIGRNTFIMLLVVLVTGGWLLMLFGISIHVIRVAGGLLLFKTAWSMLSDEPRISAEEQENIKNNMSSRAFFPMTMPITAGPGSIAVTLTLVPSGNLLKLTTWIKFGGVATGIAAAAITVYIFYRFSGSVLTRLGKSGIQTVSKLSAFILLAIGVEIIWEGIKGLMAAG